MKKLSLVLLAATMLSAPAFAADATGNTTGGASEHAHAGDHPHMHHMLKKVDTNGDGNVSREESQAANAKRFDALDTDHNGSITPEERKAAHEKWVAKHNEWQAKKQQKSAE